jgi:hypothetical protein
VSGAQGPACHIGDMSHERAAPPADPALTIVHLVVTENFAGVERYITYVAPVLAATRGGWAMGLGHRCGGVECGRFLLRFGCCSRTGGPT